MNIQTNNHCLAEVERDITLLKSCMLKFSKQVECFSDPKLVVISQLLDERLNLQWKLIKKKEI